MEVDQIIVAFTLQPMTHILTTVRKRQWTSKKILDFFSLALDNTDSPYRRETK